jgi:nitronate monooxygenase
MKAWNQNRFTKKIGIEYPIVQGPLGGFASQRLVAKVSNFGGLGSFGGLNLEPARLRDVIAEIRSLTQKPFAVNLWVSVEDQAAKSSDEAAFRRSLAAIAPLLKELGAPIPSYKRSSPVRFEDQVRVVIDEKVPVFSFIVGIPPREILDECRAKKIFTIGSATTVEEAKAIEQAGVDAVVASGFEAGGHRGSFLAAAEESLHGTFSLVPQVADAVKIPMVAAGGIADARGVVAAMALGAEAVQMGTVFLTCEGSGASRLHREVLLKKQTGGTGLTKAFTGRLARGIRNRLMEELSKPEIEVLPYPLQRALVKNVTAAAEKVDRPELMQLWAGQSAAVATPTDVEGFLKGLVEEVEKNLGERVSR